MKKLIATVMAIAMVLGIAFVPIHNADAASKVKYSTALEKYGAISSKAPVLIKKTERRIHKRYKNAKIILGNESSYKYLDNRKGKKTRYVTYELGVVTDDIGNGMTLEYDKAYYISYKRIKGVRKGSLVLSYFVWCKHCNECDDMIRRYDIVLLR